MCFFYKMGPGTKKINGLCTLESNLLSCGDGTKNVDGICQEVV